ncbi:MAG: NAD-dependent epimerase/dehydratase family protein [Kofleriaceae bacterium]|nr:NAD-dependent epimerase/dehydratase family protein [Kofleriaceae bacterium]
MDVLVLGGTGGLGKLVAVELRQHGHTARAVGRSAGDLTEPAVVTRLAEGAEAIVNCAGASVAMALGKGWRGYRSIDTPIGLAAVAAARQTGARLVYVAVAHAPALAGCAYIDAHERVARAMTDVDGVIVRPTGFFSAYASLLPMARRGMLFDIGDGNARTNPIDERDLAAIVAESTRGEGAREITCGGPEVLTRREIFEGVAAASGRRVKVRGVPAWIAATSGGFVRLVHPRIGQFVQFAVGLAKHDVIAPALGTRRFADYLRTTPAAAAAASSS